MTDDVAYQQAAQVRQLQAERENAVAYGQETRIEAIDKQLKELGVKPKKAKVEKVEPEPEKAEPEGRATKQEKQHST
jgi:ferredoxin-NADP reductase